MDTIYLSKKGIKELKKSLSQLEREKSQMIIDLHEMDKTNIRDERMARIEKLTQLENIEQEIIDKQEALRCAKQLPGKRDRLKVAIGSVVDLVDQQGRLVRYTIVDSLEANPSDGRISIKSPLGKSLVGRTLKETIEWASASSTRQLQLVRIS